MTMSLLSSSSYSLLLLTSYGNDSNCTCYGLTSYILDKTIIIIMIIMNVLTDNEIIGHDRPISVGNVYEMILHYRVHLLHSLIPKNPFLSCWPHYHHHHYHPL